VSADPDAKSHVAVFRGFWVRFAATTSTCDHQQRSALPLCAPLANQHEEMGPDTYSPGNPGHSTFEGTGSIVLHNNAKYLIVVGKGTSYKDLVSIREIN
jgi:hypothetical protein